MSVNICFSSVVHVIDPVPCTANCDNNERMLCFILIKIRVLYDTVSKDIIFAAISYVPFSRHDGIRITYGYDAKQSKSADLHRPTRHIRRSKDLSCIRTYINEEKKLYCYCNFPAAACQEYLKISSSFVERQRHVD